MSSRFMWSSVLCLCLALQQVAALNKLADPGLIKSLVSKLPGEQKENSDAKPIPETIGSHLTPEADADRVYSLPAWGVVDSFRLFSGYINVDESAGRQLFYIFAEMEARPNNNAPLILWLNGGPGCSSIGGGFMSECGPWYPSKAGGAELMQPNPNSWHTFANVLFLESPAFVGFSYSERADDKTVGDERTAVDSDTFLRRFLLRFPQYAANDFYIAGESYAGHYIPQLAWQIYQNNQLVPLGERVRLVGTLVGNAWTDPVSDDAGTVQYWWSHSLISSETAAGLRDNCAFSHEDPTVDHPHHQRPKDADERCDDFCVIAMYEIGDINPYNIYADVCLPEDSAADARLPAARPRGGALLGVNAGGATAAAAALSEACAADLVEQQRQDRRREASDLSRQARYSAHRAAMLARALGLTHGAMSAAGGVAAVGGGADRGAGPADTGAGGGTGGGDDITTGEAAMLAALPTLDSLRAALRSGRRQAGHASTRVNWGTRLLSEAAAMRRRVAAGMATNKYDPCIDDVVESYLNRPAVQRALHANQTAAARAALRRPWALCNDHIHYSNDSMFSSMLPVYQDLIEHAGLRMLVYSGDVDSDVNVLGTRTWMPLLGLKQQRAWRPWTDCAGQVGGYVIHYERGVSFATVRNAGHMVPYTQPQRMAHLLRSFLGVGDGAGCRDAPRTTALWSA